MNKYIWEVKIQITPRPIVPPETIEHEFAINQMHYSIQSVCDLIANSIAQLLNRGYER